MKTFMTAAPFKRKDTELDVQDCDIRKIVDLSAEQYNRFTHDMLSDYDFIADFADQMHVDSNGMTHCMLVLGEGSDGGVLVNSEGSSYGRYTAFLPNARQYVDHEIGVLADYAVTEGTTNTEDGRWHISFDELYNHFGAEVTPRNGIGERLYAELMSRDAVVDCEADEDGFYLSYKPEYCDQLASEPFIGDKCLTVRDLLKCNMQDIHLLDVDEEHDLATIVELGADTLTEQGKADWSDILDAKVERIYEGSYGLQIDVSGASPERLHDFSYMLAGYAPISDYEKWVAPSENGEKFEMKWSDGNDLK